MALPISEIITVDLTPGGVMAICHSSQFDEGRVFKVILTNNGQPFAIRQGDSFVIDVRKPDGTVVTRTIVEHTDTPWVGSDYLYFTTTQQMVAVAGDDICELKLTDSDDNVCGTANFILRVEKSPLDGGVQSASAIHDLETQVQNIIETEVYLEELSDVAETGVYPVNGATLVYDLTLHKWIPKKLPIEKLDHVSLSNPLTNGHVLTWNSSSNAWVNSSPGSLSIDHLSDIGDVDISGSTPYNNGILIYDSSTGKWYDNQLILHTIADVDVYQEVPGQVLTYYEQHVSGGIVISGWRNETIVTYMYSLQDVNIDTSTSADGDILVYHSDDEDWENEPFKVNSLRDVYAPSPVTGKTLRYNSLTNSWNADYIKSTDINYIELTGTLTAGSTSITLTDTGDLCREPSLANLDFYTNIYGVNPTSVTVTDAVDENPSTITLTFEAQSSNMNVKVRIS